MELTFGADRDGRLRRLRVAYHAGDRDNRLLVTLGDYGSEVDIEVPAADEIFTE